HTYVEPGNYTVVLSVSDDFTTRTKIAASYIHVNGRSIHGKITGRDTGAAISNCLIEIRHKTLGLIADGYSNTDGSYTINGLPAENSLIVGVWPPFNQKNVYDHQYYENADSIDSATTVSTLIDNVYDLNISLPVSPDAGILGRVLSAKNPENGISDIEIQAFSEKLESGSITTTDVNGYYTLTGLN
ncbi:hypothetical protein MHK_007212, partial [Candidatus Magnetomorum sp. HK-1]